MNIRKYFNWFDYFDEGVYFVSNEREILYFNEAAENISGYSSEEVKESFCYDNILNHVSKDGTHLCFEGCPLLDSIETKKSNRAEVFLHHKRGHRVKVLVKTLPVIEEGEVVGAIEIFRAVDRDDVFNKTLEYYRKKATTDSLTKLNNRSVLEERVPQLMDSSEEVSFGVIFMDIDDFKKFNDTYGHDTGDRVLEVVSRTLEQAIGSYDIPIRYGGEEFMVLAYGVDGKRLRSLAERIRLMIEASSVEHEGKTLRFTVSAGTAPVVKGNLDEAIKKADQAMYLSKTSGKNRVTDSQVMS